MSGDPSQVQWSVNVTETDTRNLTPAEIGQLYASGTLDLVDTYVWRDGMGDWVALGECAELSAVLGSEQAASPFEGTMMMEEGAAPPAAQPGHEVTEVAPPAAQQADSFAGYSSEPEPEPEAKLVGERNEQSALFSLDDIRKGMSSKAGRKSAPKKDDLFDDLIDLSSIGGGGIAAAFAPPPINTPAPPKPVAAPVAAPAAPTAPTAATPSLVAGVGPSAARSASAAPAALASPYPPTPVEKKSKMGLWLAVAAVVLLAGGVGAYFMTRAPETTAKNEVSTAKDGDKAGDANKDSAADDAKEDDKGDETAKDDDNGDETAKDDSDRKDDANAKTATTNATSKNAASTKTTTKSTKKADDKKADDKKTAKADDKKDDDKKDDDKKDAPPTKAEFNVNAARSALGSAAGSASGCKKPGGPTGKGRVTVTFAPSGRATQATVGPPFAGTSTGSCAAGIFRRARVPAFSGSPMTVGKSFYIR